MLTYIVYMYICVLLYISQQHFFYSVYNSRNKRKCLKIYSILQQCEELLNKIYDQRPRQSQSDEAL